MCVCVCVCVLSWLNPFTAPDCKIFGPKDIWTRLHTIHIPILWAVQAGLLTPLTFARHCLSPLAAFTSGAYFPSSQSVTMAGGDSEFANFTLPTLKKFLEARNQNLSGNKK